MAFVDAQSRIDTIPSGGTLCLEAADYEPIVVQRPITLKGCGSTCFWGDLGKPAIEIRSDGVRLQGLMLRHRSKYMADAQPPLTLVVSAQANPVFLEVRISGSVVGVAGESDGWCLPPILELGDISYPSAVFTMEMAVPKRCELASRVAGIAFDLPKLVAGVCQVRLIARGLIQDSLIAGYLEIISDRLTRVIPLFGRVSKLTGSEKPPVKSLYRLTEKQRKVFLHLQRRVDQPG